MSALLIRGGRRLSGTISVSGSKNIALAVLSAVPLADGIVVLTNVPNIADTRIKCKLLEVFGISSVWQGSTLTLDCTSVRPGLADVNLVRAIRTSFYMLGPLLARASKIELPAPGGCNIGARPVDLHLKGLQAMGANIDMSAGAYHASVNKFSGADVHLDMPSAGATQHLMSTAVLAKGITTIRNSATEPEIVALADFLNGLGAKVEGAGTSTVIITGRDQVGGGGVRIAPDRIQAGTFLLAGAITQGDVTVSGIFPEDQSAIASKLRECGAEVTEGSDWVRVVADQRLKSTNIKTMPHPGFPTDMQQPFTALLSVCEGASMVEETIYESRTGHINELNRMGANIRHEGRTSFVQGVDKLFGAPVQSSDLRAGASLCIAALAADGETTVSNVHLIDRGYECIEKTLESLGADISRIPSPETAALEQTH